MQGLEVGATYRVVTSVQELTRGAVVRFVGFDDIDNHHGCYEFVTLDGGTLKVCGDFSNRDRDPFVVTPATYFERVLPTPTDSWS